MGSVIRALTRSRANGQLLHDSEWRAYEDAIASGRCCPVMHSAWGKDPVFICGNSHVMWQMGLRNSCSNAKEQQGMLTLAPECAGAAEPILNTGCF